MLRAGTDTGGRSRLPGEQRGEGTAGGTQVSGPSVFDDPAGVQHEGVRVVGDEVGAVGDLDDSQVGVGGGEPVPDAARRARVELAEGFVENQDVRPGEQCPGEREALELATRDIEAARSAIGVRSPSGSVSTQSSRAATAMAARNSSSDASGEATRRLSAMVPVSSVGRCGTSPTRRRSASSGSSRTSMLNSRTVPPVASQPRRSNPARDDLPGVLPGAARRIRGRRRWRVRVG